jgi:hypothetical protein
MFYIDLKMGTLVNSVGKANNVNMPHFVNGEKEIFTFIFRNGSCELGEDFFSGEFYLNGATRFNCISPCFRALGSPDPATKSVSFEVDTYTEEYLNQVQTPGTAIYCEILRKAPGETLDNRVALFMAQADPRVYIEGVPPAPVSKYYTANEVDALLNILRGEIGDFVDDKELAAALTNYLTSSSLTAALKNYTPLKKTINDTTSTAPVIDIMATNALYTYSQPLTSLTINSVPMSALETDFSFTTGEGFQLYVPTDVYPEKGLEFNAGGVYIINIYAKRLVAGEFEG